MHLPLLHHLRQDQAGERLGDRSDFKNGVRLRRSKTKHAAHPVLHHSDRNARACGRRELARLQRLCQILCEHRLQIRRRNRSNSGIVHSRRQRRSRQSGRLTREAQRQGSALGPRTVQDLSICRKFALPVALHAGNVERKIRRRENHLLALQPHRALVERIRAAIFLTAGIRLRDQLHTQRLPFPSTSPAPPEP